MAKRFTDTGKWDKATFDGLSSKMKLVWIYLLDKCDHAGIWDVNYRQLSFHLREEITEQEVKLAFGDKLSHLSPTKVFIPAFIDFQYGELNPENRAHQSVLNRLKKEGAYKVLKSSIQGAKDKDKEKEMDKDSLKEGSGEKTLKPDVAAVYKLYPRKEGKSRGLAILAGSVKTPQDLEECMHALSNFLAHLKRKGVSADYIPHFKTWAAQWRDWLDPSHGSAEDFSNDATLGGDYRSMTEIMAERERNGGAA